jgi:hypothetical protein
MAKTRRVYAGGAAATTVVGSLTNVSSTITIAAYTGWPHGVNPFYIVLSPGTASEEKVLVTRAGSTDTTLSVTTRGVDGTTAVSHVDGTDIYPVFTAIDADEANQLASTLTTKGDLLTHGASDFARLGVGTNGHVLTADSVEATGLKWAAVVSPTIADAKGDLIAATAADTVARLAVGGNGTFLSANSGESTGLKWANPGEQVSTVLAFGSFA